MWCTPESQEVFDTSQDRKVKHASGFWSRLCGVAGFEGSLVALIAVTLQLTFRIKVSA